MSEVTAQEAANFLDSEALRLERLNGRYPSMISSYRMGAESIRKLAELQAENERLELSNDRLLTERDTAEEAVGDLFLAVMGYSAEWSNLFGYSDAREIVEEHDNDLRNKAAALEAQVLALQSCQESSRDAIVYALRILCTLIQRGHAPPELLAINGGRGLEPLTSALVAIDPTHTCETQLTCAACDKNIAVIQPQPLPGRHSPRSMGPMDDGHSIMCEVWEGGGCICGFDKGEPPVPQKLGGSES